MGKKNTITKDYMSVPERFADCFNYYLFNGEQVIKPTNLKPLDPTELAIIPEDSTDETSGEFLSGFTKEDKGRQIKTDYYFDHLLRG